MSFHLTVLLVAAVGVFANTQSGNSQAAIDHDGNDQSATSSFLTAPAELVPVSAENVRFSRLLKDSANVLQFSSISNDAPPIWGIARDGKKEAKAVKHAKKNTLAGPNFGRRALDYDEQMQAGFEEPTSETKIVANAYPGNEYVFVRPGKLVEAPADSDVAASVTSINNKPPRVPLALLRQKKGKRVNISPLFTELPQVNHDSDDAAVAAAKEFVWVDQPVEHHRFFVGVNRQGRKHGDEDEATTNPAFQEEDLVEATTIADEIPVETTTKQNNKSKLIVNIVTSAPRVSVDSSVGERKFKPSRQRGKSTTTSTTPYEATTEAATPSSTTAFVPSTTFKVPITTTAAPVIITSTSTKATPADDKENLVADAFHRSASTFRGFEDSHTRLQTAESSQPARVNVRPAQNGKEYEYEYIYYYYDDDDENGEKRGEGQAKNGENGKAGKAEAPSSSTSAATLTPAGESDSSSSTTVTVTSSSTTSTTTIAPDLTSDTDFEYDDDAALEEEEEIKVVSKEPELKKSTPAAPRVDDEPIHKAVSSAEKLSNSNPINQLDRSRGPKILPGKFDESVADYKLETEASQEDEVVQSQDLSRGQPQQQEQANSSEESEEIVDPPETNNVVHVASREPSTSSTPLQATSGFDTEHMSTLAKVHKDSVNVPIVLKQSTLLKAVPVSQLHPHQDDEFQEEPPSTAPVTTPTTTTTTAEAASEAVPSVRPSPPRLRGGHRLRGSVTPRPSTAATTAEVSAPPPPAEEKPQQAVRRPNLREGSRRIQSRRPVKEEAEAVQEQQPAASPIIETHARPVPIRPRFPPRTATTTTATAPIEVTIPDVPAAPVTVSAVELNSLEDKKAKDSHIRSKSANDLFAFARLQQAISSRAPSRVQPKLVAGFVNSAEATTDAIGSSEVTTVSSFGGQSGETLVSVEPTPTTTTTTTTEAVQLDKLGRQRVAGGPRFGGRARKPVVGGAGNGAVSTTTTTEAPTTPKGRGFSGRRRASTTEAPESSAQQTVTSGTTTSDSSKPKLPSRNRFSTRNRVSTTEATVTAEQQKTTEAEKPASTQPRRRPGSFQGRRRANQGQTDASAAPHEEAPSTSADSSSTSTAAVTSTAAPSTPGRNRFNFGAAGGRPRPGAGATGAPPAAAANNPIRIRGGGRLRGPITTTTTTEAAPAENNAEEDIQEQPTDAEQSQSIQSENLEQPIQSPPAPESIVPQRGGGGVLGRLKNRPKLVLTTTTAPDAGGDRKGSRLNGILNRRKNIGHLPGGAHAKEEVKEPTPDAAEEANNHAQEQDDDHKGVVVQVSSSVTESEEINEAHASEIVEPPSTTPGSILNRLKSQRKPGSLFRKKPDPHGE